MNVPELELDTLTWADLVELARRAIPAASEGQWTLHAPIDPGMTLVELFAAELEQRLYMLDQVPDTLVRGVMRLLLGRGAGPRPAQPAVAILTLSTRAGTVSLPAGSQLQRDAGDRLVLTTEHATLVVDGADVTRFEVGGTDLRASLLAGEPAPLFGLDGRASTVLEISAAAPAPEHRLYLAVEEPRLATGWLAGTDPPELPRRLAIAAPPRLGWVRDNGRRVLLDGDGQPVTGDRLGGLTVPADQAPRWHALVGDRRWPLQVEDGTAGLRIPGVVRLRPPPGRTFPAKVWIQVSPPEGAATQVWVSRVTANAIVARHRRPVRHEATQTEPLLALPDREDELEDAAPNAAEPLDRVLDGRGAASLTVRHADGASETWTAVDDLAFSGPGDRHLLVDRDRGRLRFGDGRHGRILRWDRDATVTRTYWLGGGTPPEIGPGTGFRASATVAAHTVAPLAFGQDPESPAAARARAAQALLHPTRAVTAADAEELVRAVAGVRLARVHVEPGFDPDHPGATVPDAFTVFCVPLVQRRGPDDLTAIPAPELDPWSLRALTEALERARLVGSLLAVRGPAWHRIRVAADLAVAAVDRAGVTRLAERALRHVLDPLVGGSRGQGWAFGAAVRPADLSVVLQRTLGRQAEVLAVRVGDAPRPDRPGCDPPPLSDCDPLPLRAYELPLLLDDLTVARSSPSRR
jgi:hypothetical protein